MTEAELLDELARAINSKRHKGKTEWEKRAFADYTMYKKKRKWWVAMWTINNKWQFWKRDEI